MGAKNADVKIKPKQKVPQEKVKAKKLKLTNNSATNNSNCSNEIIQQNGSKPKPSEDINDTVNQLPVYLVKSRLLEEIKKNHTMIVIGEPGSGKTTQIPQIVYKGHLNRQNCIAVTQPRRVAAITTALRVAAERNTEVGSIVGYTVRFEDVSSENTKIKYLTDDILLKEAMTDPLLKKYSVIILDEAHERTVSTDILFGIVKLAQKERNSSANCPLKVIIMSATMNVDAFSRFFDDCPVIYLEERAYPLTVYHSMIKHEDYQHAALVTIFKLHATSPPNHDFLVFLTGQEDIETVLYNIQQIAKDTPGPQMIVRPLYAELPPSKQLDVWKPTPPGTRKIVLATNIAEASITIPNIKYVIDCGFVKERTWSGSTGAEQFRVTPCSRAACRQRAGRAGRDSPGWAYRLYTKDDYLERPAHNEPEIMRCPLAPSILQLIATGLEPSTFPLMKTPPQESIKASLTLLKDLGAIDNEASPKLTPLGKKMTTFPVDPEYSKMILAASEYSCLEEILSIVSMLSSEDIFLNPMHKREEAVSAKLKFKSPLGEHITLLNVFRGFCTSTSKKKWCKENYLNYKSLTFSCDIRNQLLSICQRFSLPVNSCGENLDQVLQCMLSGLANNCAWLEGNDGCAAGGPARYVTSSGAVAFIHPTSMLLGSHPPAVLYTELLQTDRTYLVTVSALQQNWLTSSALPVTTGN